MTRTVTLILDETDAAMFSEFRRLQDNFSKLRSSGFFDVRNGSAAVHFDHDGKIRKIERHDVIFKD